MNLGAVDWLIFALAYAGLFAGGVWARRYVKSVADFLAAGRTAGRYLLSVASGIAALGAISIVAHLEMGYEAGFAMSWWGLSMSLVLTILAVTGWVNYRFRETRCLTLAEFFERRYSRRFRLFAGFIAFLAGLINFGIFPAVGARFFIHFLGLPKTFALAGVTFATYPTVMAVLLVTALYFVYTGGHVAVLFTDFLQGVFANLVFMTLLVFLLARVDWGDVVQVLQAVPPGHSKVNPFDTDYVETFNFGYFLIGVVGVMYTAMSWQGTQAYNTSAKSAHEAKMGLVLNLWRGVPQGAVMLFVPIVVFMVMHHSDWAGLQARVDGTLATMPSDAIRNQMRAPVVLVELLPAGLIGGFAAMMLGAFVSTHNTYLHSWASIFVQDVVMPFKKTPWSREAHLRVLRWAILGVAAFIYLFSLLFEQNQHILLFFAITGAIFAGGSGAVIIGGLYWKRGTTEAAWAAMLTGSSIAVSGIVLGKANDALRQTGRAFWGRLDWLGEERALGLGRYVAEHMPNGQQVWAIGMAASALLYVAVSLLWRPRAFPLTELLHRGAGEYEREHEAAPEPPTRGWRVLLMDEQFTRRDKFLYVLTYAWTAAWTVVFVAGTVWFLTRDVPGGDWSAFDGAWIRYWRVYLWIQVAVSVVVVAWFTAGGARDARRMFRALAGMARDDSDDGMVRGGAGEVRSS